MEHSDREWRVLTSLLFCGHSKDRRRNHRSMRHSRPVRPLIAVLLRSPSTLAKDHQPILRDSVSVLIGKNNLDYLVFPLCNDSE